MYKYEMDPTKTVGTTESGHGMRDGRTDERMEWNQYMPPTTSLCGGYNNSTWKIAICLTYIADNMTFDYLAMLSASVSAATVLT